MSITAQSSLKAPVLTKEKTSVFTLDLTNQSACSVVGYFRRKITKGRYKIYSKNSAPVSLNLNTEHTPSEHYFYTTLLNQQVDSVQFIFETETSFSLQIVPLAPKKGHAKVSTPSPIECVCSAPKIVEREDWCNASCPIDQTPDTSDVTHLVIHHTADQQYSGSGTDFSQVVNYYYQLHTDVFGWDDIGYNYLIDPDGVVYQGRASGLKGAHFSCMNDSTLGIALIGDFQVEQPSTQMLEVLDSLLLYETCDKGINVLDAQYHLASDLQLSRIIGHLDGNASLEGCPSGTVCPGQNVYPLLNAFRDSVLTDSCLIGQTDLYYDNEFTQIETFQSSEDSISMAFVQKFWQWQDSTFLNTPFTTASFLSTDSVLDGSDSLLFSQMFESDSLEESYSFSFAYPLQNSLTSLYLITKLDATNAIEELDESNNYYVFPLIELEPPVVGSNIMNVDDTPVFYPNPTNDFLYSKDIVKDITLYNTLLQPVLWRSSMPIDLRDLEAGVYYVSYSYNNKNKLSKIIKQK